MIPVCRLEDLPKGESVRVETTPPVAVFHTDDGDLHAIDDTCTHQDASLSEGWLEGCLVECPLHAASFDLRTGLPTCLPARRPVRTHRVTVDDGVIHVHLAAEEGSAA
ncbi:bifunctional 3-phenylpropionate/cinnamic acid dioxygenase ferredoxin subunit [Streptomyces sp. NPDC057838]|uniref:bifunctional 3-phenylpropionate/cinnamic acid dioxygenase ferredoxin subunit n=1 Tax=unclassified Streptomyces TaxID=2593676 RepID=UPI003687DB03